MIDAVKLMVMEKTDNITGCVIVFYDSHIRMEQIKRNAIIVVHSIFLK